MSRYLITGGLGIIGTELASKLVADGHQIRIIDNLSSGQQNTVINDCEVIIGNVNDSVLVNEAMSGVDGCFHLATSNESFGLDDDLNCNNLQGTINVLSAARVASAGAALPIVYASSSITYGDNAHTSLGEELTARPLTSAAADKVGIELRARVATLAHGIPTTGLRLFSVYGETTDAFAPPFKGVIATFMERILNDQAITIYGDGEQTRDFVYLADVVNFFTAAMTITPRQPAIYNVCTGRQTSLQQLAHLLFSLLGKPVEIRYAAARKGDIRSSVGNPELAIRHLGIRARTTLADGLKRLLASRSGGTTFSKRPAKPGAEDVRTLLNTSTANS